MEGLKEETCSAIFVNDNDNDYISLTKTIDF